MAAVKKPKVQGKNRIRLGETFGMTMCVGSFKTWDKGWRKPFPVGGKNKGSNPGATGR